MDSASLDTKKQRFFEVFVAPMLRQRGQLSLASRSGANYDSIKTGQMDYAKAEREAAEGPGPAAGAAAASAPSKAAPPPLRAVVAASRAAIRAPPIPPGAGGADVRLEWRCLCKAVNHQQRNHCRDRGRSCDEVYDEDGQAKSGPAQSGFAGAARATGWTRSLVEVVGM